MPKSFKHLLQSIDQNNSIGENAYQKCAVVCANEVSKFK